MQIFHIRDFLNQIEYNYEYDETDENVSCDISTGFSIEKKLHETGSTTEYRFDNISKKMNEDSVFYDENQEKTAVLLDESNWKQLITMESVEETISNNDVLICSKSILKSNERSYKIVYNDGTVYEYQSDGTNIVEVKKNGEIQLS